METSQHGVAAYTDTQIAKAIAEQLRAHGVDVAVRCGEVGIAEAVD